MKLSKQQMMIIAGVVIAFLIYWFFFRKKKSESNFKVARFSPYLSSPSVGSVAGKLKPGEKICNCSYLGKPEKICSKSVRCNDCCEGAGPGGHRDPVVASN